MTGANPSSHARFSVARCRRRRLDVTQQQPASAAASLADDNDDDDDDDDDEVVYDERMVQDCRSVKNNWRYVSRGLHHQLSSMTSHSLENCKEKHWYILSCVGSGPVLIDSVPCRLRACDAF